MIWIALGLASLLSIVLTITLWLTGGFEGAGYSPDTVILWTVGSTLLFGTPVLWFLLRIGWALFDVFVRGNTKVPENPE